MSLCFLDPHFVVTSPDLPYLIGGNLIEWDYVAYERVEGAVVAVVVEDTSRGDEPFEKTPRYLLHLRRLMGVVFARGKEEPRGGGFAFRTSERSRFKEYEDYRRAVGRLYVFFPDLAHVNYYIVYATGDYVAEMMEDLRRLGEAVKEEYPFLGYYLIAKAEANLGLCPSQWFALAQAADRSFFCRYPSVCRAVDAAIFRPREEETISKLSVYLWRELTSGCSFIADCRFVKRWEKVHFPNVAPDAAPPSRYIVLRDFEKEMLDNYIDRSLAFYGRVVVIYVPISTFIYDGERAPTSTYLLPPKPPDVDGSLSDYWRYDGFRDPRQEGGPPYVFEL